MASGAKQDMHWWKETALYFIWLEFLEKGDKPDLNYSQLSEIFWLLNAIKAVIPLSACLRHAKKDIINAWIVVDLLSWASTVGVLGTFGKFPRKFLYKKVWNFTEKEILLPVFPNLENIWKWATFRSLRRLLLSYFISNHSNIFQLLLFVM